SGRLLLRLKCYSSDPIEALPTFFAERGSPAIGFAALRTSRLKTRPAVVAKDRIKRILGLTFRANHNRNQSQWVAEQTDLLRLTSRFLRSGHIPILLTAAFARPNQRFISIER